ncbi:MAG: type II secretion system F family protein [Pseudomonadota bacterium]
MSLTQISLLVLVFGAVFLLALLAFGLVTGNPVRRRLSTLSGVPAPSGGGGGAPAPWLERLIKLSAPLARMSLPDDQWERSANRIRFMNAGYRHPAAPAIFFAAKTVLAMALPLLLLSLESVRPGRGPQVLLAWMLLIAAIGYYLPNVVLKKMIERRQRDISETFPDALDLMTICVEAGLGIDAALAKVASEIGMKSAILAEEMHLVTLELRAGGTKDKALRNFAMRTGVEDIDALVAMLIQAERFGTSIGDSLRVQSDQLRSNRRLRAEEKAAQIGLKLLFPLIFFIFPVLMVVLLGPAFIQIYRVLLPSMGGGQ